ncbi:uncharacterized protein EAE98_004187 [Botrytis deweyae]|uniref:Uncharacterized protein n=1 Tax=Botrytis deweyae TaxID=2478750 RepID=A0ABQ7IST8_9HELO|nr:uncharacterized protein EAE98_004187 [Botrytis deweyae]KAF7932888.1 hypothetical protein EAE98_004187 [Botrytis deweyae]
MEIYSFPGGVYISSLLVERNYQCPYPSCPKGGFSFATLNGGSSCPTLNGLKTHIITDARATGKSEQQLSIRSYLLELINGSRMSSRLVGRLEYPIPGSENMMSLRRVVKERNGVPLLLASPNPAPCEAGELKSMLSGPNPAPCKASELKSMLCGLNPVPCEAGELKSMLFGLNPVPCEISLLKQEASKLKSILFGLSPMPYEANKLKSMLFGLNTVSYKTSLLEGEAGKLKSMLSGLNPAPCETSLLEGEAGLKPLLSFRRMRGVTRRSYWIPIIILYPDLVTHTY